MTGWSLKTLPRPADLVTVRAFLERRRPAGDRGVTLVEILVSLLLLSMLASAVVAGLTSALHLARSNRLRVVAATIAEQQIELARGTRAQDLAVGSATSTRTVGATSFTVVQTVDYVTDGGSDTACDGPTGAVLTAKYVTVGVTWPRMEGVRPVRSDTLRAIGVGQNTTGHIAVSIRSSTGGPVPNIPVTLGPSGTVGITGSDGCVIFPNLPVGSSYSVAFSRAGYVDDQGNQAVSQSAVSVAAATVTKLVFQYDRAATFAISFAAAAGHTWPATLPLTLKNVLFGALNKVFPDCASAGATPNACVTGYPRTTRTLFPHPEGYQVWAGACADAKPAASVPSLPANPGQTTTGSALLGSFTVDVDNGAGPKAGWVITATHAPDAGCPLGRTYTLGISQDTPVKYALPYGTWTIDSQGGRTGTAVLVPNDVVRVVVTK